jgi:Flp pilus assembly protein protease CpaA
VGDKKDFKMKEAIFIGLLGLLYLLYFSYEDLKKEEVENNPILVFFVIGMIVLLSKEKILMAGLLMLFMGILAVGLWKLNSFGGADVKILTSLTPFFLIGSANYLVTFWVFLIIFSVIGGLYGLLGKIMVKKKQYIPFIPIITLTYLLIWTWKILIK